MDRVRERLQSGVLAAAMGAFLGAFIVGGLGCASAGASKSDAKDVAQTAPTGAAGDAGTAGPAGQLYPRASRPLDPAIESNWPEEWSSPAHGASLFASFVRHAETSPGWLLLSWRGEAVFVRADPEHMEIEFQADGSNKIKRLTVNGPCESLSLRMYVPAEKMEYDLAASKLAMWKTRGRRNPAFPSPGQSSP